MLPEWFDYLLTPDKPLIKNNDTNLQKPIFAEERLALTIRALAIGNSQLLNFGACLVYLDALMINTLGPDA